MADLWKETVESVMVADELLTSRDHEIIQKDLIATLRPEFGQQPLTPLLFGSRVIAIASKSSDLDIFVDTGNNYHDFLDKESNRVQNDQAKLYNGLNKKTSIWEIIKKVEGQVPIVTVLHKQTNIQCDINVTNGCCHAQNQIVKYLFEIQPIARFMCVYLRNMFAKNNLQLRFRSHVVVLMVIFYLQTQNLLPSIEHLQRKRKPDMGPWISVIEKETLAQNGIPTINLNAKELKKRLEGFFDYYAKFNYSNTISPYLGKVVPQSRIHNHMPERYHTAVANNLLLKLLVFRAIVVQDFVQLNQNKTYYIVKSELTQFRRLCQQHRNLT